MPLGAQRFQRFKGEVGVDRFRAVARQHAEMMHFARFAGFDHQPGLHPQALPHQVMMHRSRRQQRRHRHAGLALRAVGQHQNVVILQHRLGRGPAHFLDRQFEAISPACRIPGDVDRGAAERTVERLFDRADLGQIFVGEDRLIDLQPLMRPGVAA